MGMRGLRSTGGIASQGYGLLPDLLRQTKLRRNTNRMRGKHGRQTTKTNTRRTGGSAKHGSARKRTGTDIRTDGANAKNANVRRKSGDVRKYRFTAVELQRSPRRPGTTHKRRHSIGGSEMAIMKKKPEVHVEEPKVEVPAPEVVGCQADANGKPCGKSLAPGQSAVCTAHVRTN